MLILFNINKAYDILDGSSNLEQNIVFMSLCENEEDDNTCGVQSIRDSNGDIENIVINVGSEISNNDQFSCLVKGDSTGANYFEFSQFHQDSLLSEIVDKRDDICEQPKSSPTKGGPWWTKSPTPKPTRKIASGSSSSSGKWLVTNQIICKKLKTIFNC